MVFIAYTAGDGYFITTRKRIRSIQFLWNDEPGQNVDKCAQHGVSQDEWEFAFLTYSEETTSASSGRLARIGPAGDGRTLFVVFELICIDGHVLVYPVTGYEIEREL